MNTSEAPAVISCDGPVWNVLVQRMTVEDFDTLTTLPPSPGLSETALLRLELGRYQTGPGYSLYQAGRGFAFGLADDPQVPGMLGVIDLDGADPTGLLSCWSAVAHVSQPPSHGSLLVRSAGRVGWVPWPQKSQVTGELTAYLAAQLEVPRPLLGLLEGFTAADRSRGLSVGDMRCSPELAGMLAAEFGLLEQFYTATAYNSSMPAPMSKFIVGPFSVVPEPFHKVELADSFVFPVVSLMDVPGVSRLSPRKLAVAAANPLMQGIPGLQEEYALSRARGMSMESAADALVPTGSLAPHRRPTARSRQR